MKRITMTDSTIEKSLAKILKTLKGNRKASVSLASLYNVPADEQAKVEKPLLYITEEAYRKMDALVQECDVEIAWHNTVTRDGNTFTVLDTLCYPQVATHTTVESDDDLYPEWQEDLDDDTYNTLRMQGHSHVNMGVAPSGTDEEYYDLLLKHVKTFYVFLIMNKRGEMYTRIYDMESNYIFEHKDIEIFVPDMEPTWGAQQVAQYVHIPEAKALSGKLATMHGPWGHSY